MLLLRTAALLRKKLYKPGQSTSRGKSLDFIYSSYFCKWYP